MIKSKRVRTLARKAEQGKPFAMYQLGLAYLAGKEIKLDEPKGYFWIRLAAIEGYLPAKEYLEDVLLDDDALVQGEA